MEELSVYFWEANKMRYDVADLGLFGEDEKIPWSVKTFQMCAAPSLRAVAGILGISPKLMTDRYAVRIIQEKLPRDKMLAKKARAHPNKIVWRLLSDTPGNERWQVDGEEADS